MGGGEAYLKVMYLGIFDTKLRSTYIIEPLLRPSTSHKISNILGVLMDGFFEGIEN